MGLGCVLQETVAYGLFTGLRQLAFVYFFDLFAGNSRPFVELTADPERMQMFPQIRRAIGRRDEGIGETDG